MDTIPTNDEMSVKRSKKGIDMNEVMKQPNAQHYFNSLEQGKPIETKRFATMMAFVSIIFIGFIFCYLLGHWVARAHYNDELQKRDSIYMRVQTTDAESKHGWYNGK